MHKKLILAISLTTAMGTGAMAQERQWALDVGDSESYLVFGVPESDDVGISFWCANHSGEISLFVPDADAKLRPGRQVTFRVNAGGKTFRLNGNTTANEEAGSTSIETKLADSHPLFPALRAADRFKVRVSTSEIVYPLIDADLPGLLEVCRKP